ncbi:MAG: hypothetical protein QOG75_2032 [Mycobacterium sp.]|nr:hypothetical protein [Mycobacterium sp.]
MGAGRGAVVVIDGEVVNGGRARLVRLGFSCAISRIGQHRDRLVLAGQQLRPNRCVVDCSHRPLGQHAVSGDAAPRYVFHEIREARRAAS